MKEVNEKEIRTILRNVRKQIVSYAEKYYPNTCPIDLAGWCGIASYLVFLKLVSLGYEPTFNMNDYHCYITLGGYWLDLTLKQFNGKCPLIYCRKKPFTQDNGYGNIHVQDEMATSEQSIRRLFEGWDKDQNPYRLKPPIQ